LRKKTSRKEANYSVNGEAEALLENSITGPTGSEEALRLRDIIDIFCKLSLLDPKEEKKVTAEDVLSCGDSVILAELIEILQPYLTYTKHFKGRIPRFAKVLPTIYLFKKPSLRNTATVFFQPYPCTLSSAENHPQKAST
jgi:hypothetical protein